FICQNKRVMDKFPLWADHIAAFVFCIAVPLYAARQRVKGSSYSYFTSSQKKSIYISGSFSLFIMAAIVMSIWLLFRRPVSELGLTQPTNTRTWLWITLVFVLVYLVDAAITLS